MDDRTQIATRLERLSEQIQPDPSAFQKLDRRRSKTKRNRKLGAIGVALSLSAIGTFGVVRALSESGSSVADDANHSLQSGIETPPPCPVTESIVVVGDGTGFDTDCLAIVEGRETPFVFRLKGHVMQSFVICDSEKCRHSDGTIVGTEIVPGPEVIAGVVPALEAGTYYFVDQVHPQLAYGTLYVVLGGD